MRKIKTVIFAATLLVAFTGQASEDASYLWEKGQCFQKVEGEDNIFLGTSDWQSCIDGEWAVTEDFEPNSCQATAGTNQFVPINGQCVDMRNSHQPVNNSLCYNSQVGFNYDQRCQQYGFGQQPFNQGGYGFNYAGYTMVFGDNACANTYGYGWVTTQSYQTGQRRCEYVSSQFGSNFNPWMNGYVYGWIGLDSNATQESSSPN